MTQPTNLTAHASRLPPILASLRGSRPPLRRAHTTMLEVVFTFIILAIFSTTIVGHMQMMQRLDRQQRQQSRAILVLDNTLERLAAYRGPVPESQARAILETELAASGIPAADQVHSRVIPLPAATPDGPAYELAIVGQDGHMLARVEVRP